MTRTEEETKELTMGPSDIVKEDYCGKELSELLRKKGLAGYKTPYSKVIGGDYPLSIAVKWFRVAHNLSIEPISVYNGNNNVGYVYSIASTKTALEIYGQPNNMPYDTCEDAVRGAIKYSLENLL